MVGLYFWGCHFREFLNSWSGANGCIVAELSLQISYCTAALGARCRDERCRRGKGQVSKWLVGGDEATVEAEGFADFGTTQCWMLDLQGPGWSCDEVRADVCIRVWAKIYCRCSAVVCR